MSVKAMAKVTVMGKVKRCVLLFHLFVRRDAEKRENKRRGNSHIKRLTFILIVGSSLTPLLASVLR